MGLSDFDGSCKVTEAGQVIENVRLNHLHFAGVRSELVIVVNVLECNFKRNG